MLLSQPASKAAMPQLTMADALVLSGLVIKVSLRRERLSGRPRSGLSTAGSG